MIYSDERITILHGLTDRVGRKYSLDDIKNNTEDAIIFGTLGYSKSTHSDLSQISHMVSGFNIDEENGILTGVITILDTPMGLILQELISKDFNLKTAMRGTGILDKDDNVSEFTLLGIDLVQE